MIGLIDVSTGVLAVAQAAGTDAASLAVGDAPDFSVGTMFMRATLTVQIVMVLLALASFWSWAIILEKAVALRRHASTARQFETAFWSGKALDQLFEEIGGKPASPVERVFVAGMTEWRKSILNGVVIPGTQARLDRVMATTIAREVDAMGRRLSFLASVGSVAPFVGLFGTVWGIKHAFENIALQQNTNLAVVAPGIAEALLATALGLLAAIPAVLAYNRLSGEADAIAGRLEAFSDDFSTILARQIDRRQAEAGP